MTLHPGMLAGVTGADLCISWSGRMPEMLLLSNSTAPGRAFDPGSFQGLGLIPFQVNAHYPYAGQDPSAGETRQQRIAEFLEENDVPVLGLREGTWLRVSAGTAVLGGVTSSPLFRRGTGAQELPAGADVSELLGLPAAFDAGQG